MIDGMHKRLPEDIDNDEQNEVPEEVLTMDILGQIANEIHPFLQFTTEVSRGATSQVPCLDTQLWYGPPETQTPWYDGLPDDQRYPWTQWSGPNKPSIMYKFYRKPMVNPMSILERSRIPESVKRAMFTMRSKEG